MSMIPNYPAMNTSFTQLLAFFVLFLFSGTAYAQDCNCTVTRVDNRTEFSPGCEDAANICSLDIGDNVNQVDLKQFTDLRGIHVKIGRNVSPSFLASALSDEHTKFIAHDGVNMVIEDPVFGEMRFLESGAGNNPNSIKVYNKQLKECTGSCTLLQPTINTVALGSASASLPVTLLSWEATALRGGVELTWATESETDNDYFTVARSSNGKDFTEIGRITGEGTSERVSDYRMLDADAARGVQYYRLEQVDFDGQRTVLGIRQVEVGTAAGVTTLSPNPAAPGATVRVNLSDAAGTPVRIVDLAGRPAAETVLNAGGTFQLPVDLQAGLYIVIVREQALRLIVRP